MTIKVALIGFGVMGKNHYRVLNSLPDVKVVAVVDPLLKDKMPVPVFKDFKKLLSTTKLDAVIVAVPTKFHFEVAIECIKKGIPTLIEKPVAATLEQAASILKAAQKKKVITAVGHTERFNPVVQALKQELKRRNIFSLAITRVGPIPPRIADVGILTDLSVHDIDLIREVTGREIQNSNIYSSRKVHGHHEDNAVLSFRLEDEIVASVTTNWLTPFKKRMIEVATREAYYEADLLKQELTEYSAFIHDNNSYVIRKCDVTRGEPLVNELKAFMHYVRTGENHGLATIEDSMKTLQLIKKRTTG